MSTDRQKVLYPTNTTFVEKWDTCGRQHFGNAVQTVDCLQKEFPALSDACAACMGAMTACVKRECMFSCVVNSQSNSCQECTRKKCRAALIDCTGIEDKNLPRFPSQKK